MEKHRIDLPAKLAKIILVVFLLLAGSTITHAQTTASSKDNSTTEQQPATDPLGRTTPRGSVSGYLDAIRSENFERAAQYFYVLDKSISQRFSAGFESARDLKILLDREGSFFEASALSNQPSGDLEDALAPELEQVGVLEQTSRKIPILMQRSKSQDGTEIWLFSSQTINRIPFLLSVSREGLLDSFLPDQLKQTHIASVSVGHWMALAVAIGLALTLGYFISWITTWVLAYLLKSRTGLDLRGTLFAIKHPLAILLAVSIYRIIINNIGLQVVARDTVGWLAVIATWCAVVWLAWTLFDNIGSRITEGMTRRNRKSSLAVVMLARRAAKAVILAVAAIYIFDLFGLDVTTGLAALGHFVQLIDKHDAGLFYSVHGSGTNLIFIDQRLRLFVLNLF